jgi:hypothetical protein
MAGELLPTSGDIRPHGHLKLGRFTQHFIDVLDLEMTPLDFFEKLYPNDPREEQRKYLGRFGISGKMQVQKMSELSDGQKSRVVFAKLGRDSPHILLLDEPTVRSDTCLSMSLVLIFCADNSLFSYHHFINIPVRTILVRPTEIHMDFFPCMATIN